MTSITTKELSAISDLLTMEQTVVAKYRAFAEQTTDSAIKNCYEQLAMRHQRHFEELYANLK